jgi:hypothetical protein
MEDGVTEAMEKGGWMRKTPRTGYFEEERRIGKAAARRINP